MEDNQTTYFFFCLRPNSFTEEWATDWWRSFGDVANSKRPLLIIPKVQLRLRVTRRSSQKLFAGKNFVKILVTAQTQLRSYSEQQRAFGNSLGSRREAFLSQNISRPTCMCSFTFNPAFHQNSKVFSYNLALPLIYWSSLWQKQNWPLTIEPIENTDKKSQNCLCQRVCV